MAITQQHFAQVKKRDGRIVPFDQGRITNAIFRAMKATGEGDLTKDPGRVSDYAVRELMKKLPYGYVPNIEEVQDGVESALILMDLPKTAKAYILYRNERAQIRAMRKEIPEHVQRLAGESKKYFRNSLAEFVYYRTYSRWNEDEDRRETWIETVDRYINFMRENVGRALSNDEYEELRQGILRQEAMPSMRLLQFSGKAARRTNICAYNCSFIAPTRLEDFGEIMYILMCGTGVGFSVESQTVEQLPFIKRQTGESAGTYTISDTKEGWADALVLGLRIWFRGRDIQFDFSKLRPAGARLKTMGGKSSGPDPLRDVLQFARQKVLARQGKRLRPIDVHDIICKIGEVVVAGGVRRSALISLSDLDDSQMRDAKTGQFYLTENQRSLANNSAVYNTKPSAVDFLSEWLSLAKSGTGERGIFNRGGLKYQLPERRWKVFAKHWATSGTNPCGEIILRNRQFCNLSEVVARPEDTEESLLRKIRLATILGTYQATLTNLPYLSREWRQSCEEERLLGVSITGQWDCPTVREADVLLKLKEHAIRVNQEYSKRFGINPSTCITCTKPSGNLSQTVDASSGLHPRHSKFYIRRVRISATDSLLHMLKDQKVPYYPEVGQGIDSATTFVLEFPVKAPEGAITRHDFTALEQLEYWKRVKQNFVEHNPSVTIYISENEWISVANWLYENWDMLGGLSFLPKSEHVYALAPYEEITEERYNEMMAKFPPIDFASIVAYEKEDETEVAREFACVSGVCEVTL